VEPSTGWVQGRIGEDGAIETECFNSSEERVNKARRFVSEDGLTMTTEAVMYLASGETTLVTTHKKNTEAPAPTIDNILGACPVPILCDASPEGTPHKESVISESVEDYFSTAEKLLAGFVAAMKAKGVEGDEREVTLDEKSDTEFHVNIVGGDGGKCAMECNVDKDAGIFLVSFVLGGKAQLSVTFQMRSDPVRVEASSSWGRDHAYQELQNWLLKVIRRL